MAIVITKNMCFVLGAGASAPYGFPSGKELVDRIKWTPLSETARQLLGSTMEGQPFKDFKSDLQRSGVSSIDQFLESRPEYRELGKRLIAHHLIPGETMPAVFGPPEGSSDERWYTYLFDRMCQFTAADGRTRTPTLNEFRRNELSVITFNYDRSLEFFLHSALTSRYSSASPEDIKAAVESIPIQHIHGQLGFLPWQEPANNREYERHPDTRATRIAASGIRIIYEDKGESLSAAVDLLVAAKQVHFLGFGYHPENMRRLRIRELCEGREYHSENRILSGTTYGWTDAEVRSDLTSKYSKIDFRSEKCLEYLRNNREFLFHSR